MTTTGIHHLRRTEREGSSTGATSLELFYDLVFVFAITQISHYLLGHLSWEGAGQATVMLMTVWWSWNYTTWLTNELDPDSIQVRLVIVVLMLASLLMAVAISHAFGEKALLFAGAYATIQVGRTAFLTFAASEAGTLERRRASRILIWFSAAAVFWIAGALADGSARTVLWLIGLALDYGAPAAMFRVPGLTRVSTRDWDVGTSHFAERFQLFVIIALGESIVITGATTAGLEELDLTTVIAFSLAFLSSAALWWLYFDYVAKIAERRLELAEDRTKMARDGYTYLHAVMIAGVIVSAVGDELVIAHPSDHLHTAEALAVGAGPAIYLLGHVLFRLRLTGSVSGPRASGALACLALGLIGSHMSAIVLGALLFVVVIGVIAAETIRERRRRQRGEPTPMEKLDASAAT